MRGEKVSEPIAIVGSGCRFAGGVKSPSELWNLLCSPVDLSREVPKARFNPHAFYHPDGEHHGTTNSIKGYWLEQDHRAFDASFFSITPREAEAMDPQHRMTLEVVYEALEATGYPLHHYSGQKVAVFSGLMSADYDTLSQRDEITASQYYATGNARSMLSNRISYFFNFQGPSMTIDTACSSSLVALHQAVLSLRSGECVMACVTGTNLILTPEIFLVESSLHMLSPTGKCRMWDAGADGYARGDGVAAVFLKPLSRALADGDCIEAIIRGTGVNSDGRTPGITMPNSAAQAALIKDTYHRAGLDPTNPRERCQYFEAHGTGTQAGDPREASAIQEAFFAPGNSIYTPENESDNKKLLVGSIKTIIGHTEGAAGLAGLLKVIHSMKNGMVPPNLHLETLNPSVAPSYKQLQVPTVLTPWPDIPDDQPRRASVNSFGFGGTNSHAILELFDPTLHADITSPVAFSPAHSQEAESLAALPLLLSANSRQSLRLSLENLKEFLKNTASSKYIHAASTLAGRTVLPYRVAIPATPSKACESIDAALEKSLIGQRGLISATDSRPARILAIFTGQGAQWVGMSRSLLLTNMTYRESIRNMDQVLKNCKHPPEWSLEEQILACQAESRISEAAISQPLCTALQIGLTDLLHSVGVRFDTVVGHSSGEIGAAYAAGRLIAADAILIAYYRGKFAYLAEGPHGEKGAMLAVGLSRDEGQDLCNTLPGKIFIAAENSPSSMTISGDEDAIHTVNSELTKTGAFVRKLNLSTAYHSPHMIKPARAYMDALRDYNMKFLPAKNKIRWISTVAGYGLDMQQVLSMEYWADNMTRCVRFQGALEAALSQFGPFDCALEIGPHPALKGPTIQTMRSISETIPPYIGLLNRNNNDEGGFTFAEALCSLWSNFGSQGVDISKYIKSFNAQNIRASDMPRYPWDYSQNYWLESRVSRKYHSRSDPPHELLGVRSRDDNEHILQWRNVLKVEKVAWLGGHTFQGQALVPASAYCIMALDAALAYLATRNQVAKLIELVDLVISSGITLDSAHGVETTFSLHIAPTSDKNATIEAYFNLSSCPADGTIEQKTNMYGRMRINLGQPSHEALPIQQPPQSEARTASPESFYDMMDETGLIYKGPFRALRTIDRRFNFSSTTLARRHQEDTTRLAVSPATLDTCFQSAFLSYSFPGDGSLWTPFLPASIQRVTFNVACCSQFSHSPSADLRVETHLTQEQAPSPEKRAAFTVDISICNHLNQTEIQIEGLVVSAFAHTRPEEDCELYLHTVLDIDPESEIIQPVTEPRERDDDVLVEEAKRVVSHVLRKRGAETEGTAIGCLPRKLDAPGNCQLHPDHVHKDCCRRIAVPNNESLSHPTTNDKVWLKDDDEAIQKLIDSSAHSTALEDLLEAIESFSESGDVSKMCSELVDRLCSMSRVNQHVGRILAQIGHKYPKLRVLDMTKSSIGISFQALDHTMPHLESYVACKSKPMGHKVGPPDGKITCVDLDLHSSLEEQLPAGHRYDVVILSTASLQDHVPKDLFLEIQKVMSSGAYVLLLDRPESLVEAQHLNANTPVAGESPQGEDWSLLLDEFGFGDFVEGSHQIFRDGSSIFVRRALGSQQMPSQKPAVSTNSKVSNRVLVIGGVSPILSGLRAGIEEQLHALQYSVTHRLGLEELDTRYVGDYMAVIVMADLDNSIVLGMTEPYMAKITELMRPGLKVLWLTHGARGANPAHSASLGFIRTIISEVPSLDLRLLDLEVVENSTGLVRDEFLRMMQGDGTVHWDRKDELSIPEREVFIQNGRRMIPRVLPWKPGNDRLNAGRRPASESTNSLQGNVQVSWDSTDSSYKIQVQDLPAPDALICHGILIQVAYSSLYTIGISRSPSYICVGKNVATGESVIAFSETLSSFVQVPPSCVHTVRTHGINGLATLDAFLRYAAVRDVANVARGRKLVLLEPDLEFLKHIKREIEGPIAVLRYAKGSPYPEDACTIYIHPLATSHSIRSKIPLNSVMVNCLFEDDGLSGKFLASLPNSSEYHSLHSLASDPSTYSSDTLEDRFCLLEGQILSISWSLTVDTVSVPDLLRASQRRHRFTIVDWAKERTVSHLIKPLTGHSLLRPSRTYILVGITQDMGQSLSQLFLELGARYIVLASRTPKMAPKWKDELSRCYDATIVFERLDVADLAAVRDLKARLLDVGMPPVAGVVNGAMVLEDRIFAQMTLETWNRVLEPKTTGSKNLDLVFDSDDMDFFIMTSSFAAVGGHSGQSNYAAANMYMNGLAFNRRARGLVASVLNIGVVYGLGFLLRQKEHLYKGLEREGYPPISERDLHHMFTEAIAAGRKDAPLALDLTTGLSRFDPSHSDLLHWHEDPRFCHFTTVSDSGGLEDAKSAQKSLLEELATIGSQAKAAEAISLLFIERLETVLMLPKGSAYKEQSMAELGVDSLIVVDIRNWFFKVLGKDVAALKILGSKSIWHLCLELAEQLGPSPVSAL